MASTPVQSKYILPSPINSVLSLQSSTHQSIEFTHLLANTEPPLTHPIPQNYHNHNQTLGLILMASSALFFSTMSALVKQSGSYFYFPTFEIVLVRSIIQFVLAYISCTTYLKINPWGDLHMRKLLVLRGMFGSIGLGAYFYAMIHGNLGDMTTLFFTGPILTAVFAYMWLNEPLGLYDGISMLACLIGIVLVVQPSGSPSAANPISAILAAFLGASMTAAAYVCVRKIGARAHAMVLVGYLGSVSSVWSFILMVLQVSGGPPRLPNGWAESLVLFLIGLTAFIAQVMLNRGLQLVAAGPGALMRNLDVVFAYIYGICLFHEQIDYLSILGASIIVGATMITGLLKYYRNCPQNYVSPQSTGSQSSGLSLSISTPVIHQVDISTLESSKQLETQNISIC